MGQYSIDHLAQYRFTRPYAGTNVHKDGHGETVHVEKNTVVDVIDETSNGISFLLGGQRIIFCRSTELDKLLEVVEEDGTVAEAATPE
jgi:hypothetical protein